MPDRPLPEEMFYYARSDTHFLLYIYDNLRNQLVERSEPTIDEENRIELVLQKSKETSLLRYESQIYDEKTGRGAGGWYSVLYKMPSLLSKEQFSVFRAVHAWRDTIARQDDDSTNYVMPNHVIFTLAKLMPTDLMSLHNALRPISHNVKSRVEELLEVIKDAKENGNDGPSMMEVLRPDSVGAVAKAMAKDEAVPIVVPAVVVDEKELRSEKSGFWGGAFGSSTWEKPVGSANGRAEIRLAIPLPPVASNAFSDNVMEQIEISQVEVEEIAVVKEEVIKDEPFTLKAGKKRKSDMLEQNEAISREAEASEPSGEYDISLNDPDEEELERAGRKAERRAAKKAKKEQRLSGNTRRMPKDEPEDEEPFDYTKAESVLNRKHTADQKRGPKTKKPFDPYSKSGDAAKGMRRSQTERAGKSFTFKS
jgi:exosome complex exonuclease RRP6